MDVVLEPVTYAAGLDVRRHPVGGAVVRDQLALALGGPHVPRIERVVDERRLAAPALGVRVQDRAGLVQKATRLRVVFDPRVRLLHWEAGKTRDRGQELAVE